MKLSLKQDILLNIILPVLAGSGVYFMSVTISFSGFCRNHIPDGLWAYAFSSALLIIWNRQINIFWSGMIYFIFILFEALQYFHIIKGTGDWLDIIIYFSFSFLTLLTNKYFISLTK